MLNKQDYLNAFYQNIEIVKGDTLAFNIQLHGLNGATPTFLFTCKENPDGVTYFTSDSDDGITLEEYNAETDTATYSVYIAPSKTEGLELARYYYDLKMELNGDIYTLMRGRFELLYKVG